MQCIHNYNFDTVTKNPKALTFSQNRDHVSFFETLILMSNWVFGPFGFGVVEGSNTTEDKCCGAWYFD